MIVRFWGVRGSIPTPGPNTIKYGGNTACLEVRGDNDELLIIDAGTGLRELGNFLISNDLPKGPLSLHILLSHTHWDHIQGFPFFGPAYIPTTNITFYGPANVGRLEDIVAGQMTYSYFPIKLDELKGKIQFKELQESNFTINNFKITTKFLNHPILDLGYRIEHNGKTFVTVYDTEPYRNLFEVTEGEDIDDVDKEAMMEAELYVEEMNAKIQNLIRNANLCVYDAQYRKEEYQSKLGWGHSTVDHAVQAALEGEVQKLALFHHDPLRTDEQLDEIQKYAQNLVLQSNSKMVVFAARERLQIEV